MSPPTAILPSPSVITRHASADEFGTHGSASLGSVIANTPSPSPSVIARHASADEFGTHGSASLESVSANTPSPSLSGIQIEWLKQ